MYRWTECDSPTCKPVSIGDKNSTTAAMIIFENDSIIFSGPVYQVNSGKLCTYKSKPTYFSVYPSKFVYTMTIDSTLFHDTMTYVDTITYVFEDSDLVCIDINHGKFSNTYVKYYYYKYLGNLPPDG
jgi:hypothetical protein